MPSRYDTRTALAEGKKSRRRQDLPTRPQVLSAVTSPILTLSLSRLLRIVAPALLLLLGACATRPPASDAAAVAAYEENNDLFEPTNRVMFKVDMAYRESLLNPFLRGYRAVVPAGGRRGVLNFEHNLHSPVTFVHDVLQGSVNRAGQTLGRLVLNTTVGFFGFFDVAAQMGI
ncbi:MAG: MlaA family lipoprotein, partial [Candidatus Binataceae bacterium]